MKILQITNPFSTLLLISLLGGGLTLSGVRLAAADSDGQRSRHQTRFEQQDRRGQAGEVRKEHRQTRREGRETVRDEKRQVRTPRQENRRQDQRPAVAERRTVQQNNAQTVRSDAHRETQLDQRNLRQRVEHRDQRPVVVRERSVTRSVTRPAPRSEVHDARRSFKIQQREFRPRYQREHIVKTLPYGSKTIFFNRERYHSYRGHYYRHTPRGYLLVRPPIGTLITDLPFGFLRVTFGGLDYFVCNNIFYRHTAYGYRVVATPAGYQETAYGPVRVETAWLNIRTGPGLDYAVIGRLQRGELLIVTASNPGWYYVLLPGGAYGWVMSHYTSTISYG